MTVSNGQSQALFYYKNSTVETVTLAADSAGYTQGNQAFVVNAATADTLAMTGVTSLTSGVCSPTAITMTTNDAFATCPR